MAAETTVKDGAVASPGGTKDSRGMRTLVVASSALLWVFALFAITSLNSLRAEVKELRGNMASVLELTKDQSLEAMQVVDQDGEVVYTFKRSPPPPNSPCGMMGLAGCGMGACGTVGAGGTVGAVGSAGAAGCGAGSACPDHGTATPSEGASH